MNELSHSAPRRQRLRVISGHIDRPVYGSDIRRPSQDGVCGLCEEFRPLMLSHIAPRWSYRAMKAEGGVTGRLDSLGITVTAQDGAKHYLLCSACEQHLGEAEAHLALLSRGNIDELALAGIRLEPGPRLWGVKATLVRRAVLGILLKGHLVDSPVWQSVNLSPKEHAAIRRRVLADDYSGRSHPLLAIRWMACAIPDANPRAIMVAGVQRTERWSAFDLMLGGWSWTVVLRGPDSFREQLRDGADFGPERYLNDGPWHVSLGELAHSRAVSGPLWAAGLDPEVPDPEGWKSWAADAMCPCGLDRVFSECCAGTWCGV